MIHNKIHLISPGCARPSIVQNCGLKHHSFHSKDDFPFSVSLSLSVHTHTHTHTLTLTHTHTLTHTPSHTHTLTHTPPHTLTHTPSHTHTLTHSLTHTLTHTHTHSAALHPLFVCFSHMLTLCSCPCFVHYMGIPSGESSEGCAT